MPFITILEQNIATNNPKKTALPLSASISFATIYTSYLLSVCLMLISYQMMMWTRPAPWRLTTEGCQEHPSQRWDSSPQVVPQTTPTVIPPPSRPLDALSRACWRVSAPQWQRQLDTGSTPCSLQGCRSAAVTVATRQMTMLTGTSPMVAPFTPHSQPPTTITGP